MARSEDARTGAVVVAAGSSSRMGGIDKLWLPLGDAPLIEHGIRLFVGLPEIDHVVVVLSYANLARIESLVHTPPWSDVEVVTGGVTRAESVYAGLTRLEACHIVVVHDGARPFVSADVVRRGLDAAREWGAAVPALAVSDTVKRVDDDGLIAGTVDRTSLRTVQTPQVFRYDVIRQAYETIGEARTECTDDASILERLGLPVATFPGDPRNIKVTTPHDVPLAEWLLHRAV